MLHDLLQILLVFSLVGDEHTASSELELGDLSDLMDDELWFNRHYCS